MPYYHVTDTRLNLDQPIVYPNSRMKWNGKPVGLWYAPDTTWIELEKTKGVHPYAFKYIFPLEGKFVEDIETPGLDRIFRLTSRNIDTFEAKFQPYFLANLYKALRDEKKPYDVILNKLSERADGLVIKRDEIVQSDVRAWMIEELNKHVGDELKVEVKTGPQTLEEMLQPKKTETIIIQPMNRNRGTIGNRRLFDAIRLIEYGKFFDAVMKPIWGGIDYDASLFTDDLKRQYPFIVQVEIPSGCLWHPKDVMVGYKATPVTGGRRTIRKKLRKSTRRRR